MNSRRNNLVVAILTVPALVLAAQSIKYAGPTFRAAGGRDTAEHREDFQHARSLFRRGRFEAARHCIGELTTEGFSGEIGMSPLYLAICCMANGSREEARVMYRGFVRQNESEFSESDRLYFESLICEHDGISNEYSDLTFVNAGVDQANSSTQSDLGRVVAEVRKAKGEFVNNPTVQNQIVLASWLTLFGELGIHVNEAGLFSNSYDAIAEGLRLSDELAEKEQELQTLLGANPLLAVRYDVVRARKMVLQGKQQIARTEELKRLSQLRQLAHTYRGILEDVGTAQLATQFGDGPRAGKASTDVITKMGALLEIVGERRDYYLFQDEPRLDGENTDFDTTHVVPSPYSKSLIAFWKGQQALLAVRSGIRDGMVANETDLAEALKLAQSSLPQVGDADPEVKTGTDSANVLAHVTIGLVNKAKGLKTISSAPLSVSSHRAAAPDLDRARKAFGQSLAILKAAKADTGPLGRWVQRELNQLGKSSTVTEEAARLLQSGRVGDMATLYRRELSRRIDGQLVLSLLEADLRAGRNFDDIMADLEKSTTSGLLSATAPAIVTFTSKALLRHYWNGLRSNSTTDMPVADRTAMLKRITETIARIEATVAAGVGPVNAAQLESYRVFAIALKFRLQKVSDKKSQELAAAALISAKRSGEVLTKALAGEEKLVRATGLRETLICNRLATGFLAIQSLPEYRRDSQLAFAAALDQQSQLPYNGRGVPILGSQTLAAVLSRTDQQDAVLARNEVELRKAMSWTTESMIDLHFGDAGSAAKRMEAVLQASRRNLLGGTGPLSVDASKLLQRSDSGDQRTAMVSNIVTVQIRALIAANQPAKALDNALEAVLPASAGRSPGVQNLTSIDDATLTKAMAAVTDAAMGYTLAIALEAYIVSLEPGATPLRLRLIKHLGRLLPNVGRLANGELARSNHPWLPDALSAVAKRFSDPNEFLGAGREHEQADRLTTAVRTYRGGVQRFPASQPLWAALLRAQLEMLLRVPTDALQKTSVDDLRRNIIVAGQSKRILPYRESLYLGLLEEHASNHDSAMKAYRKAIDLASTDSETAVVLAKYSSLRARPLLDNPESK